RAAKRYGLDSILVGQHYLSTPYQMLQPMPLLGRIATEAEGMRIGTGITLLPLLNPVAVAEEAATMDVICRGRFILGVGLGYREVEDSAFGVKREEKARKLGEALEVIKLLWEGKEVDFRGKSFQLRNARIGVRPVQNPRPTRTGGRTVPSRKKTLSRGRSASSRWTDSLLEAPQNASKTSRDLSRSWVSITSS